MLPDVYQNILQFKGGILFGENIYLWNSQSENALTKTVKNKV